MSSDDAYVERRDGYDHSSLSVVHQVEDNNGSFRSSKMKRSTNALSTDEKLKSKSKDRRQHTSKQSVSAFVGSSPEAETVREKIKIYAKYDAPVLICGETGVGKELVARELHSNSPRSQSPFIAVNAAAIPENLAGSELFGHVKGAFTGAEAPRKGAFMEAGKGVLLLDEIGDLPQGIQAHLLRVLDTKSFAPIGSHKENETKCRVICATNVDLIQAQESDKFREDLFYRLNVLAINVPPLRKRGDDVIEIAEQFIATNEIEELRSLKLSAAACDVLRMHDFPGNVRELRNLILRACINAPAGKIRPEDLIFEGPRPTLRKNVKVADAKKVVSRYVVLKALTEANGNIKKASEIAGVSRDGIYKTLKELNLPNDTAGKQLADALVSVCCEGKRLFENC